MGVTSFDIPIIERYLPPKGGFVIELGAQNNYAQPNLPAPYMRGWYEARGLKYTAIDLSGEDGCEVADLSRPLFPTGPLADLVTDFGTSEHIDDYYTCWRNKWDLCIDGGYIISENPMTGNWPGHGKHYLGQNFYTKLANYFPVVDHGVHPAMGNDTDGWNAWGVIRKNGPFLDFDTFKTLPIFKS